MRTILLLSLLILLPFEGAQAAPIDLYAGEAVVGDQGLAERRRALPLALGHVLRKISGLRQFDDFPLVEPSLGNAASMVVSFHYRIAENMLADGSAVKETRLVARFSEKRVDELVRSLELPLWQPERKPVTIWLVIDNGLDRRIMPVEFDYVRETMDKTALSRGMPVRWPSPDSEGIYPVDVQLLWGGYTENLDKNNGTGALILAARREGAEWSVRANLGYNGEQWAWRTQDIDLQSALVESMQQSVDQIVSTNTIAASDMGAWLHDLTVVGLSGANDYWRCLTYLQDISVVSHVSVLAAQPGSATFRLELNALPRYLEEAVLEGGVLAFLESEDRYVLLGVARNDG